MTYHAGTSGLARFGVPDGNPRIVCDGCGIVYNITAGRNRMPPAWFLDGKAKPGWRKVNEGTIVDPVRRDYCPRCKR